MLDIVLTSREMGKGSACRLAGIPYHAAEGYIARLIAAGHKVAICEQIGEVTRGKGLVERDVTRVVTPGHGRRAGHARCPPQQLHRRHHRRRQQVGLAAADITTGEFIATEIGGQTIADRTDDCRPRTAPAAAGGNCPAGRRRRRSFACSRSCLAPRRGDPLRVETVGGGGRTARRKLCSVTSGSIRWTDSASRDKPLATRAAGGLLHYLLDTQLTGLKQITSLRTYSTDAYMTLDLQTRRNLELLESARGEKKHSLIAVLDLTRTPMGARMLRHWLNQPLLQLDELKLRQRDVRSISPVRTAREPICARDSARSATSSGWQTARSPGPSSPRELDSAAAVACCYSWTSRAGRVSSKRLR